MTTGTLRLLEQIHGHLAWLGIAALLHPVIVLRVAKRRAVLACSLATASVTLTASLGLYLYPEYRRLIKHSIFVEAPALGWMFERKEHLAAASVLLAWAGLAAHLGTLKASEPPSRTALWRTARIGYAASFVLAATAGAMGIAVANHRGF